MSTLKSYLTCNFDDAEAVDVYYLQVYRGDDVIWAGVFNGMSLTEDYEFSEGGIIGEIISSLRVGNDEPLLDRVDNTIYGEWLTAHEEKDEEDGVLCNSHIAAIEASPILKPYYISSAVDDIDEFLLNNGDDISCSPPIDDLVKLDS
jgi:hypothetical protein